MSRTDRVTRADLALRCIDDTLCFTVDEAWAWFRLPTHCSKFVQASLKSAGVRKVRMHDFRHGCVSVLLALGVPPRIVMEIAGHSALEMTKNVYAHVSLDDKREALDRLGALYDSGPIEGPSGGR